MSRLELEMLYQKYDAMILSRKIRHNIDLVVTRPRALVQVVQVVQLVVQVDFSIRRHASIASKCQALAQWFTMSVVKQMNADSGQFPTASGYLTPDIHLRLSSDALVHLVATE